MQAQDIMITEVFKVNEKDTVRSIIKTFVDKRISGLPVVNDKNEIIAYVSDGDIMRFIGKHKDLVIDAFYFVSILMGDDEQFEERVQRILDLNVMELAQKKVQKVQWHTEVEDIAAILGEKRIKKLPVVRDGVLVGIISRGDIIRNTFKGLL